MVVLIEEAYADELQFTARMDKQAEAARCFINGYERSMVHGRGSAYLRRRSVSFPSTTDQHGGSPMSGRWAHRRCRHAGHGYRIGRHRAAVFEV